MTGPNSISELGSPLGQDHKTEYDMEPGNQSIGMQEKIVNSVVRQIIGSQEV